MIVQEYKYSPNKKELKPVTKQSQIHSIRFGEHNPHLIFVNKVGDKKTNPTMVTSSRTREGIRHEFQYAGTRYSFMLPAETKRGQLISIDVAR